MTIGERIKQARKARKWTQSTLAEAVGTAQDQVARWEKGVITPGRAHLTELARVFDCTTDWLLGIDTEDGVRRRDVELTPDERQLLELYRAGELPNFVQTIILSRGGRGKAEEPLIEETGDQTTVTRPDKTAY